MFYSRLFAGLSFLGFAFAGLVNQLLLNHVRADPFEFSDPKIQIGLDRL